MMMMMFTMWFCIYIRGKAMLDEGSPPWDPWIYWAKLVSLTRVTKLEQLSTTWTAMPHPCKWQHSQCFEQHHKSPPNPGSVSKKYLPNLVRWLTKESQMKSITESVKSLIPYELTLYLRHAYWSCCTSCLLGIIESVLLSTSDHT